MEPPIHPYQLNTSLLTVSLQIIVQLSELALMWMILYVECVCVECECECVWSVSVCVRVRVCLLAYACVRAYVCRRIVNVAMRLHNAGLDYSSQENALFLCGPCR